MLFYIEDINFFHMLKIYYLKLKDFEKYHITKFEIKYRLVKLFLLSKN